MKHLSKDDRRVLARHARDKWCHKDFNGRQIRNTVKTALTLARQDGEEVQARHFEMVLDIGKLALALHRGSSSVGVGNQNGNVQSSRLT